MTRYLFEDDFMADPSVHVFNDRVYIYPSHDIEEANVENDNGDCYIMKDYHVLSTDDVMSGKVIDHGKALDLKDIPWARRQLWDCDCAEKDGKYYMYFPAKNKNDIFQVGVAIADAPEGPFIPQPDPIRGSYSIDMCVFRHDKDYLMYFGGIWGGQLQRYKDNLAVEHPELPKDDEPSIPARVVRLTEDMLQFAEEPRPVVVVDENGEPLKHGDPRRFFEASWMHERNGIYYFSYSTGDFHTLHYAMADNPYGPFKYAGKLLDPVEGWTTHHSIVEYKGKWYMFHHDSAPSGKSWLRSLKVCEIEYDTDGKIRVIK